MELRLKNRVTTKFWDYKTNRIRGQIGVLMNRNPALLAVLATISFLAWDLFQKKALITSLMREDNDPNKLHRNWRAADLRIDNVVVADTLTWDEWEIIADVVNRTFDYGRTWSGRKTKVVHLRDGGSASEPVPHVHVQVPRFKWRR